MAINLDLKLVPRGIHYNAMIRKTDQGYLDKLQRRAASINEGYTVSQPQISRTCGWPTLQYRRDYLKYMLVFHGLAPVYEFSLSHAP